MFTLPDKLRGNPSQKLFAWNGLAFLTPASWELAQTELSKGINRIVLEDDFSPRLELDWVDHPATHSRDTIQKNYQAQARALTQAASGIIPIPDLPPEWTAHEYRMPDKRTMVIGYRIPGDEHSPFPLFRLHFDAHSRDLPAACFRQIANSLCWFNHGLVPWAFYDVAFAVNHELRLAATSLQAGRKTISFEWKLRRMTLWFISLANLALRTKGLPQYAAEFLNSTRIFPVPLWQPGQHDTLAYHRRKRYFLGQFEELGRLCFRYQATASLHPDRNQIQLQMLQYRRASDLDVLTTTAIQLPPHP